MNKNHFKKVLPYLLLIIFVAIIWPRDPQIEVLVNEQSSKASTSVVSKPQVRQPDRSQKFITADQIKIKPTPSEKADERLVKKVPAPPLSKELHAELAEINKNGYGKIATVDQTNTNPQKASVIEAIKTGQYPERLSLMAKRQKFNYASYQQEPDEYLNIVVPSRAYETAQPGEGVKRLTRASSKYVETYQEEVVELQITGDVANAPISASALDGGYFSNDLSAITVQADSSGSATLQFTAGQGVIRNARVISASPLSTGTVSFNVYGKKKREDINE